MYAHEVVQDPQDRMNQELAQLENKIKDLLQTFNNDGDDWQTLATDFARAFVIKHDISRMLWYQALNSWERYKRELIGHPINDEIDDYLNMVFDVQFGDLPV